MRAFTGIWTPGMIPQMLQHEDEENSEPEERHVLRPSGPMVCRMMPSWMKS